jgi:Tol biopolymer transport system component
MRLLLIMGALCLGSSLIAAALVQHDARQAPPTSPFIAYSLVDFNRNRSSVYVMNADGSEPRHLVTQTGTIFYVAWRGDGRSLVYSLYQQNVGGHILEIPLKGGESVEITTGTAPQYVPVFGEVVFSQVDDEGLYQVYVLDEAGAGRPLDGVQSQTVDVAFSPEGDRFIDSVTQFDEGYAYGTDLIEVTPGVGARVLISGQANLYNPAWSADGTALLMETEVGTIVRLPFMADGRLASAETVYASSDYAYDASWSPDGAWIIFGKEGSAFSQSAVMRIAAAGAEDATPLVTYRRNELPYSPTYAPPIDLPWQVDRSLIAGMSLVAASLAVMVARR